MVRKTYRRKQQKNKSVKNKKRLMRGGFEEPKRILLSYTADLNAQLAPIFEAIDPNKLIYISVGSKYNEDNLERHLCYPTDSHCPTNSAYQMVPYFLCKNSPARQNMGCQDVVCIAIDIFNDESDVKKSIEHIKKQNNDTSNIKMFIINLVNVRNAINSFDPKPHSDYMKNLIEAITIKIKEKRVEPKNYMVSNYVKFKHPNSTEFTLQDQIKTKIQIAVKKHDFIDSYYDWCGYDPMMYYNCITKTSKQPTPIAEERGDYPTTIKRNNQKSIYNTFTPQKQFEKMFVINKARPIPDEYSNADNNFVYSVQDIINNFGYNLDNDLNL